jgi:hypothetical protein
MQEMNFAHDPAKANAPGGPYIGALIIRQITGKSKNLFDGLVTVETTSPGIQAKLLDPRQFLGATRLQMILL